jgi:phosphatidylglycerophosphate synthase
LKTFIFSFAIGIMFFVLPAIVKKNIYNNTWEIWMINLPIIICLLLSLVSGFQYVWKARSIFKG